jgi:hypothetical protein
METRPDNLAETATYHLRENSGRGTCVKHVFVNHVHPKRAARLRGKSPGPQCSLETLARGEGRGAQ